MDYDDHDFQCQSFQIVGEDINKLPPSFQLLPLPRFDFDEQLQIHPRFDSLVETEVLLGIQDNSWMEDFTPLGSEIEFSTTAADTCSIPSPKNVWSEATSSESVEMLLESVGVEEMPNQKVTIKEEDAGVAVIGMDRQTDSPRANESNSETDSYQLKVEGSLVPSEHKNSGKCDYVSTPTEKFNSDEKFIDRQCTLETKLTPSPVHAIMNTSAHSQAFCGAVRIDDPLHNTCIKCTTDGSIACVVSDENSDLTLRSTEDSLPKQVMGESNEMEVCERPDLFKDSAQKKSSQFEGNKVRDQPSQGSGVRSDLSSAQDSEPLDERCSEMEVCESPDLFKDSAQKKSSQIKGNKVKDQPSQGSGVQSDLSSAQDSEPLDERCSEMEVCERPDLLKDSAQKKSSQIEGNNVRDQPSQGSGVRSGLSSAQDLEPLDETCSDLEFPVKPSCFHESQSEGPLPLNEVVEHQELTTTQLPASVLIQRNEKEAENSGSTIMKNNITNAQLLKEYDHPVTVDSLSTKAQDEPDAHEFQPKDRLDMDVVVEQKEETAAELPALLLIQPDEKQVETSGTTIFKSKKGAAVSRKPDDPIISDRSLSEHMDQDERAVATIDSNLRSLDNPTVTHWSQSEGILSMDVDVDVEQKDVEIPDSTKLMSKTNAQFSVESDDAAAVNNSSVKEMTKDESAIVDSSLLSQNKSSDAHQAQPDDTISLDLNQKEATTEVLACHNEKLKNPGNAILESTKGVLDLSDSDQSIAVNSPPAKDMTQIEPDSQPTALDLASSSVEVSDVECQTEMHDSIGTHENAFQSVGIGSPTVIGYSGHAQGDTDPTVSISNDPPSVSSETRVKDDKVKSCSHDSKESKTSEDTRSFTFEVGSLTNSERDHGNKWKPFSDIPSSELPQCNLRISKENNQETILESEIQYDRTITENPEKDNTTNVSALSTTDSTIISPAKVAKETSAKKKSAGSDGNPCSTSKSVRKKSAESASPCNPPKSIGAVNRNAKLEETQQHYSCTDSNIKESHSPVLDSNISISALALFHQPFTDLQQVQLRAQIFVYGSLMQGNPPDEACMISAFGGADGGRCLWEGLWRLSAEKYQIQKSPFNSYQTPDSVTRASEQVTRCSPLESQPPSISSQIDGKVAASATNSMLSLPPPPLWSASLDESHSSKPRVTQLDFNQASTSSYSQQPSQIRQYTVNSAPWFTHFPHPEPWVDSSQNATVDAIAQYSTVPLTEAVQATPARVSSIPHVPSMQLVTPTFFGSPETKSVSATPLVQTDSQRKKMTPRRNKSTLPIDNSRSRQKDPLVHEVPQPNILVEQLPDPASVAAKSHIIAPIDYQISRSDTGQRAIFSEETCTKLEQAKLQAEDAAAFAASAVRHSQDVWNELATRKNSGLVSGVDGELASAAVAVAAAANVAKAAAAAAKVASDAALQAKLMADEAMDSVRTGNLTQISESGPLDVGKSLVKLTPYSILKGKDEINGSSSIISTARETARRRVETACAATKRAENLVAIMRAAELAAEAVSQAGIIIAMGEPLPFTLSGLVEAGLEGHWKGHHSSASKPDKTSSTHGEENLGLDCAKNRDIYFEESHEQPSNIRRTKRTYKKHGMLSSIANPVQPEEHCEVLPDLQNEQGHAILDEGHQKDHSASYAEQSGIQKGCLVEVKTEGCNLKGGWFSARVLDVKDGKCYICYENLVSDEGSGLLKEWVLLEGGADKAPRIRLAHPVTTTKYEGLRKRRREDKWAVGDHVDAWICDGWREGIVTERSHGDDTKLTVRFTDGDDSSTVRASDLRVTLVWKDGSWIEWCNVRENAIKCEDDTPREKRQKLCRMEAGIDSDHNGKGANKVLKDSSVVDSRNSEELRPLNLSVKERVFSVGNNAREENTCDTPKFRQAGLQKEGSRVVFGVPKPGKKRKFMEVSKHYVEDKKEKTSEVNSSVKLGKYMMPPPTSRVLRNTSKVDSKGKGAVDSKPVGFKSARSRSIRIKSTADKNNSSFTSTNGGDSTDSVASKGRAASSNEQKNLEKKGRLELGSHTNLDAVENPHVEPQMFVPVFSSSRKKPSSTVVADPRARRKLALAVDKSSRSGDSSENTSTALPDASDLRRSNRRIQPTARLLEGLQSSLVVSKIPSFPHEKGNKAQSRGASSRGSSHD